MKTSRAAAGLTFAGWAAGMGAGSGDKGGEVTV